MSEEKAVQNSENYELSIFNVKGLGAMMRLAKELAPSEMLPDAFKNKPANVLIALNMAQRMDADPFAVMQSIYIVYGKPAFSANYLIGCFNGCGRFSCIKYEFFGQPGTMSYGCRAYATELRTGEKVVGPDVTLEMAKREGWLDKKGSKWQTLPQLMLQYRAATFLIRTTAPELALGMRTSEEINDEVITINAEPSFSQKQEALKQEMQALSEKAQVIDVSVQAESVAPVTATAQAAAAMVEEKQEVKTSRPSWMR